MSQPLVSVVTPFRNTGPYLAECIDSVLAQTYPNFEYILSDNCSTDGSREIAEAYAQRDSRIRFIRQPKTLSQGDHYNNVLTEISGTSQYCKLVQADDYIFPECLQRMIQTFELSDTIGLVSSYYQKGDVVRGSGFPHATRILPGKEMGRLYLRTGIFVFGSESTVMYRSSLLRECRPFYDDSLLHADTEKCMQILEHWDFGFVHQVLSFLRMENVNESISAGVRSFHPDALDRYIIVQRYAPAFLSQDEAEALKTESKRWYYAVLADDAIHLRGTEYWRYHKKGLKTVNETLDWAYLTLRIVRELLWMAVNPGTTAERALRYWKHRLDRKRAVMSNRTLQTP